jgi:hypothetical protein
MTLHYFFLDGAQGLIIIPFLFIAHLVFTPLAEGTILYFFKYNRYKNCLLDALLANLASLIVGLFLLKPFNRVANSLIASEREAEQFIIILLLFYVQTVLTEWGILKLLNRKFSGLKLILPVLLMNLLTYIVLYFIVTPKVF